MSASQDWSPDDAPESETFEQGDDALDEEDRLDRSFLEAREQDPSLDPTRVVDVRELQELGAELDEPEALVALQGGIDDPDGLGGPPGSALPAADEEGWDLDAPL